MVSKTNHERAIEWLSGARQGRDVDVDFVSPIVSAMIACECVRHPASAARFKLCDDAAEYAATVGLAELLDGRPFQPVHRRSPELRYSPLARLAVHAEVEAATDAVTESLHAHVDERAAAAVDEVCRVIGELHDNVASHANGAGFSALQVYPRASTVEFAIVDTGVGLLANAKKVLPHMARHADAIRWAFRKGTTSAASAPEMAQRLPEDATQNPYPPTVATFATENHHVGEGLWQLLQLVGRLRGSLWVMSGDSELEVSPRQISGVFRRRGLEWQGVAIEVTLPV